MNHQGPKRDGRDGYHHGNLREALIQAALSLLAERGLAGFAIAELARAVGVSSAAPYRHFRDRDAVVAEVARRGFEGLRSELLSARRSKGDPVAHLERCAQVHLAFARRESAVCAAMFDAHLMNGPHPELSAARDAAFAIVRQAAVAACERCQTSAPPPPLMVALHIWSLTHGIAGLFVSQPNGSRGDLPMLPAAA